MAVFIFPALGSSRSIFFAASALLISRSVIGFDGWQTSGKGCLSSYLALTHVLGHERQHQTSQIRDAPNDQEGQYQILSTVSVRNSSYTGEFNICFWLYKEGSRREFNPHSSLPEHLDLNSSCIMGTFDPMYVLGPPFSYSLSSILHTITSPPALALSSWALSSTFCSMGSWSCNATYTSKGSSSAYDNCGIHYTWPICWMQGQA